MKKTVLFVLLLAFALPLCAQKNNLLWTMTVKVKMDRKLEWEKKAPLFMKTHYPQYSFRVYEVTTGERTGSYVIVIGPMTYADLDKPPVFPKGFVVMRTEGQALDAISESTEVMMYRRQEKISTMNPERKLATLVVSSTEIEIGSWPEIEAFAQRILEVRKKNGSKMDIDFFRPSNSGSDNMYGSVRYVQKMEEFDIEENLPEWYDAAYGNNSWYKDYQNYQSKIKSSKREMRVFRPDLSTPLPTK